MQCVFWRAIGLTQISWSTVALIKQWEINTAHDYENTLINDKKSFYLGNRDTGKIFGSPVHTAHDCETSKLPR